MKKTIFFLILLVYSIAFPVSKKPSLIIYISIDQMRADYFDRYGKYFHGGLQRLSQGIVFANGDLNYASSETGPGHATLGTGCYPKQSGIFHNDWFDGSVMRDVYCVADSTAGKVDGIGGGFSPRNLAVPAIGDWLKRESPQSKVITASSKDRAAILMGGKHPDYAFWYSKSNGKIVTSDYYTKQLPEWVKSFNASQWIEKNVPDAWTKSLPEEEYNKIGPDEFIAETPWVNNPVGAYTTSFPHVFNPEKKKEQIMGTPYGDKIIMDFGVEAVKAEKLGQRNVTDILCLSFSNCDYVGHGYGPDSHEMLDHLIKLDDNLGIFFLEIDKLVGEDNYVVALSADHAVCPLPEFNMQFRHIAAKRYDYDTEVKPKIDSLSHVLQAEFKSNEKIFIENTFINYSAGIKSGLDSLAIEKKVLSGVLSTNIFVNVYFRRELIGNDESSKPFIQKFRNSFYAPRAGDFQTLIRENCIISGKPVGTTHGSPYTYDTHVPVIFWWNGIKHQTVTRTVHTVDIAPTLASYSGFSFPKTVDGVPLMEVIQ